MNGLNYEEGRGSRYADFVIAYRNSGLGRNRRLSDPSSDRYRFIT